MDKTLLNRRKASCGTINGRPIFIIDNIYLEEMAEMVSRRFSVTREAAINAIVDKTKHINMEGLQQWNINDIDESTPNNVIIEGTLECFDAWCLPGADDIIKYN